MGFSSDFIVGFPGETDKDFQQTLQIIKEVKYAQCYSFKYSPRPGTPGANSEEQIPEELKAERLAELQALISYYQKEFNQNSVNHVMEVLFDKKGRFAGQIIGKSPYMQSVYVDNSENYIEKLVDVKITSASQNSLYGKIIYNNFLLEAKQKETVAS
jgi:tRNA-2-methylthio-N6-dimethylallyladenosine synthase